MASDTRERRIIDAVACPQCQARIGQLCYQQSAVIQQQRNRPILHQQRREAWQSWKKERGGLA